MTREEAIKTLRELWRETNDNWYEEAYDMAIEALQAEDADVYKAHEEEHLKIVNRIKELQYAIAKTQTIVGELVESADAEPTVIRSRTLMPTKDFKEWAKRVREENPNAIIIPCDAEVVAVETEWIPCSERLPEEDEYVGNVCKYYLIQDEYRDMHVAHLSGRGWETIESVKALGCDVVAWMPLPTPYKGGDDE